MTDVEKFGNGLPGEHAGGGPKIGPPGPEKVGGLLKHADSNDADEALKVLQGLDGETIVLTPEEEKTLLRKIDRNLSQFIYAPFCNCRRTPDILAQCHFFVLSTGSTTSTKRQYLTPLSWASESEPPP